MQDNFVARRDDNNPHNRHMASKSDAESSGGARTVVVRQDPASHESVVGRPQGPAREDTRPTKLKPSALVDTRIIYCGRGWAKGCHGNKFRSRNRGKSRFWVVLVGNCGFSGFLRDFPSGKGGFPKGIVLLPKGNASLPKGMAWLPMGIVPVPTGVAPLPKGVASLPEGVGSLPTGVAPLPKGVGSLPVGVALVPVGVGIVPTGTASVPVDADALPTGGMRFADTLIVDGHRSPASDVVLPSFAGARESRL